MVQYALHNALHCISHDEPFWSACEAGIVLRCVDRLMTSWCGQSLNRENSTSRFYCAAWNADAVLRWEFCPSVCPSVCLSVKRVDSYKTKEKSVQINTIRKIIDPSFLRKRMIGGATPSTWNFESTDPRWSEIADFQQIIARSASTVTPSEKSSINTNRKSTARFPMSRTLLLSPPKGNSKTQNGRFFL